MVYPLKMVIFHSYVKLPEGILLMLHWDSADSECESAQQCSAMLSNAQQISQAVSYWPLFRSQHYNVMLLNAA